jgi:hypothetical protein
MSAALNSTQSPDFGATLNPGQSKAPDLSLTAPQALVQKNADTEAQAENDAYQKAAANADALLVNVGGPDMPIFVHPLDGRAAGTMAVSSVSAAHRAAVNAHIDAAYKRAAINAKINTSANPTNNPASTSPPSTNSPVGVPVPTAKDLQTNP